MLTIIKFFLKIITLNLSNTYLCENRFRVKQAKTGTVFVLYAFLLPLELNLLFDKR